MANGSEMTCLREHLPLQQGLRPDVRERNDRVLTAQRASSITTRINTEPCGTWRLLQHPQRASSITTRIKTVAIILIGIKFGNTQRASSITTRIKTVLRSGLTNSPISQRASSITTRIKTYWAAL